MGKYSNVVILKISIQPTVRRDMMTEPKTKQTDDDFVWKFRIRDLSPVFREVNTGIFTKVGDGNVYTCDEAHHAIAEQYISEGKVELYTPEEDPLVTPAKRYTVEDGRFMVYESKSRVEGSEMVWKEYGRPITDNFYIAIDEDIEFDDGEEKTQVKYNNYFGGDNNAK